MEKKINRKVVKSSTLTSRKLSHQSTQSTNKLKKKITELRGVIKQDVADFNMIKVYAKNLMKTKNYVFLDDIVSSCNNAINEIKSKTEIAN